MIARVSLRGLPSRRCARSSLAPPGLARRDSPAGRAYTFATRSVSSHSFSRSQVLNSTHPSTNNRRASSEAIFTSPLVAPQVRAQSSLAALRPTTVAQAETVSATPRAGTGLEGDPYFRSFVPAGKTRLPMPLPPEVVEQRTNALRKRMSQQSQMRSAARRSPMSPMAFGDFTTSTLQSINSNEAHYTSSYTMENLAILRACLSTGLTLRASKIFDDLRRNALELENEIRRHNSPRASVTSSQQSRSPLGALDVSIYNAMIGAYLRRAWQEESVVKSAAWVSRAWSLFDDMNGIDSAGERVFSIDPQPDPTTFAVFAKGIVRLMRSQRYPQAKRDLGNLLATMRRSSIAAQDVILSPAFSHADGELLNITSAQFSREGEPDARIVLQMLTTAAADLADTALSAELQSVNRMLKRLERKAEDDVQRDTAVPLSQTGPTELLPVKSTQKDKGNLASDGEVAFNLRVLRENLSFVEQAREASTDPYERQRWLEFSAIEAARKRFDYASSQLQELGLQNATKMRGKRLQMWMWEWYRELEAVLEAEMVRLRQKDESLENHANAGVHLESQIYPFLRLLTPKKLALITILEIVRLQGTNGVVNGMKTSNALVSVGKHVEAESYASQLSKNDEYFASSKAIQLELRKRGASDVKARQELKTMLDRQSQKLGQTMTANWTSLIRARVGGFLVQNLINVAKVSRKAVDRDNVTWDEVQPAFYSTYQYIQGKRLGVIKLNDVVSSELSTESTPFEILSPRHLPMLVPPKPWVTHESGGYYSMKCRALRYKEAAEQGSYLRKASEDGDLDIVLAALDVLGTTAWTINRDVYEVMAEVWNSGKDVADMPPLELSEEEPERPHNYDSDIKARGIYLKRMKFYALRKAAAHSQRCDINYKLEIARAFLGERFYFPHNMDFRGRAYPIPPHLTHIGNDLCRGLLLFADAKPLGNTGLRWLRIHLANVYGFDKASLAEREQFAIDNMEKVTSCVRNPLSAEGDWWLYADDPWQCLATCFELARAHEHPHGPEAYESHLPVHQDGTCNGLQHYAALGGDLNGAKQVNLSQGDRPADVYSGVADLVIRALEEDAAQGHEEALKLQGKVTRKVVKQTVMTTVYGVTFIGAKEQVSKQLADRGDVATEDLWKCASYLAKQIMDCIGNLFSGAEAIQNWLTLTAMVIAKSIPAERLGLIAKKNVPSQRIAAEQMTAVIWTTPLGLPVVQPYRKLVRKQLSTTMQTVFLHDPQLSTQVSPAKQASAFPPNFIHSLDATHMFLTALECQQANLTFASVHDSYWTHACDIGKMSDIIRDTFVRLHSCEILQRLRDEFLDRYKNHYVPLSAMKSISKKLKVVEHKLGSSSEVEAGGSSNSAESESAGDAASASQAPTSDPEHIPGFVPLAKLLPPIPKKGSFDVNEIRRSLYFFS